MKHYQVQVQDWGEAVAKMSVSIFLLLGAASLCEELVEELFKKPKRKSRKIISPILKESALSNGEWIFYRTRGRCFYCSKQLCLNNRGWYGGRGAWEADHFIPFSRGGADQLYNLVAACVACNREKSSLFPWVFAPHRFAQGDRNPNNYIFYTDLTFSS